MFNVGDQFPVESLTTVDGKVILFKNQSGLIHFELRRFSGCPLCNLHIKHLSDALPKLKAAGIKEEVVVFHSEAHIIKENQLQAPFTKGIQFIADPELQLYKQFGIEDFDESKWELAPIIKVEEEGLQLPGAQAMLKNHGKGKGGENKKPLDVLVDTATGKITAIHYGQDPYDQWSVSSGVADGQVNQQQMFGNSIEATMNPLRVQYHR